VTLSRAAIRPYILRLTFCAGLFFLAAGVHARAQESQAQAQETAALDRVGKWKLINTAIFAVGLAWFLAKYAPAFFNARSADIQKSIQDATGLKIEADFRYSAIDKKMANLAEEIKKIREQAHIEMEREHERIRHQTELEAQRIHHAAVNEINALRKEAADRVQLHTAQVALGLAERRLQDRFAQGEPDNLVDDFIHLVEHGKN
jgi:F0F1-type ATP synthase membrane subunit b/b'